MPKNIKTEIMSQIKSGQLGMKARWFYIAKRVGLKSGLALSIVILIFLLNIFLFYLQSNHLFSIFGARANNWQIIIKSLPYDLILIILLLALVLNYLLKRFDFSYRRPFTIIFSVFIATIVFLAFVLFVSNFNIMIQKNMKQHHYNIPYLSQFYLQRCPFGGNHAAHQEMLRKMRSGQMMSH